jgi:hypothetical protein
MRPVALLICLLSAVAGPGYIAPGTPATATSSGTVQLGVEVERCLTLAADFVTSSTSPAPLTGMGFTPTANATYRATFHGIITTAATTTAPNWRWSTVTGTDYAAGRQSATTAGTTTEGVLIGANGILTGAINTPAVGNNPLWGWTVIKTGATPSGDLVPEFASEVGGSAITVQAGAEVCYRRGL